MDVLKWSLSVLLVMAASCASIVSTVDEITGPVGGVAVASPGHADENWSSFRGNRASGVAEGFATPVAWNGDAEAGDVKGIEWKTKIPGLGHSSPVIWGDRLFVTTAVSDDGAHDLKVGLYGAIWPVNDKSKHTWKVMCLDKKTGKILWSRDSHHGVPQVKRHTKATHANCTMATDGEHAVAFFGSEGLYCYSMDGELVWKKDLGKLDSAFFMMPIAQWGFASSPIIHAGKVVVQCDVLKNSFLAAFDVKDGKELWRTSRKEVPTWSTPTIVEHDGRTLIVVNGWKHIGGYDFETGEEVWRLKGGGDIPTPTPIVGHGLVFICNAHGGKAPIYAIEVGAKGELSAPIKKRPKRKGPADNKPVEKEPSKGIAWFKAREGSYMPTPIVYGDHLYVCRDSGVLSCYDAKTGERLYRERLGKSGKRAFTASSVAADGKIYLPSEEGGTFVVKAGPKFELLATNQLGEVCLASPAISEGRLYFRTKEHIVAVGGASRATPVFPSGEKPKDE